MELCELYNKSLEWSTDRGILQHSTVQLQALKLVSEVGELALHTLTNTDVRDDIGDILVLCTNTSYMAGFTILDMLNKVSPKPIVITQTVIYQIMVAVGEIADCIHNNEPFNTPMYDLIVGLTTLTVIKHTTLQECWTIAYNDIKNRTGQLDSYGGFIKDEV